MCLDVDSSFTSVEGEAEGFIKVGTGSLLAVRVGGRNVSGEFPFQEAAYIGGRNNVRGLETNRFAGEASVFGSVEFRGALRKAPAYLAGACLLYTSPSPRDGLLSRMPSSA